MIGEDTHSTTDGRSAGPAGTSPDEWPQTLGETKCTHPSRSTHTVASLAATAGTSSVIEAGSTPTTPALASSAGQKHMNAGSWPAKPDRRATPSRQCTASWPDAEHEQPSLDRPVPRMEKASPSQMRTSLYSLRLPGRHDLARLTPRRPDRRSRTTPSRNRRDCPQPRPGRNRTPQLQPITRRPTWLGSSNREAQRKKSHDPFFRQANGHSRRPSQLSPRGPRTLQERPKRDREGSGTS